MMNDARILGHWAKVNNEEEAEGRLDDNRRVSKPGIVEDTIQWIVFPVIRCIWYLANGI